MTKTTSNSKQTRKTKYSIETLLPYLGKLDQRMVRAINQLNNISIKDKKRLSQIANPRKEHGLNTLTNGYRSVIIAEIATENPKITLNQKESFLQVIRLNKSNKGKKALYQCMCYEIMKPLLAKCLKFLDKKSEETAIKEFENQLISNSEIILELNGRKYIEEGSIKKSLNASPLEMRKLSAISQEARNHKDKKLFPIDGLFRTLGVST